MLTGAMAPVAVVAGAPSSQVPTIVTLKASDTNAESAQSIQFVATVENANRHVPVSDGQVKFVVNSPTHEVLGEVKLDKKGQAGITTSKLTQLTTFQVNAIFVPPSRQFASSASAPASVTISPLSVTGFRVVPALRRGHLNQPATFTVTALSGRGHVDPNFTGTVVFSSPTDSWTIFPKEVYESLNISAPPPQTTGLATFSPAQYTFTTADHGSHTFVGGVTFEKAGAEILKVSQANDKQVHGTTTFAIG